MSPLGNHDKKRWQGRPAKRWRDDLDRYWSDMIWQSTAQDRLTWRRHAEAYQVSSISRETHAFRPSLTLTRPWSEISRMAVNVTHILVICMKYPMCLRFLHNSAYPTRRHDQHIWSERLNYRKIVSLYPEKHSRDATPGGQIFFLHFTHTCFAPGLRPVPRWGAYSPPDPQLVCSPPLVTSTFPYLKSHSNFW